MANDQCSKESNCAKTSEEPYLLDSSTFLSEEMNNVGEFRFNSNRHANSSLRFSNNDCTVEWIEASQAIWIPIETKAKLHSGKWSLEFDVEWMGTHQIGVGFLLDWNIGPDWGFFGYLGSSRSAWSYDPSTGDIVTNTESVHGNLPKFSGNSGVIGLELDLPKNEIGKFTFIVDGVRTPTKQLPKSGAVAIPAVCLLSRGQKVTIRNLIRLNQDKTTLPVRNFSPIPGHRYFARTTNGAIQFTEFGINSSLIDPVTKAWTRVVCSIERMSTNSSRIRFNGPVNTTIRSNLALRLSYDEAHSWSVSRILYSGLSAYSDIAIVGNGTRVALVFENGEETFADRISVAIVPASWIENG
ncbi:unnamed protein product [Rotaria sp. Silwood1]|nr:unnamed protein product [Rotaria sp. Silwood1]